MQSVRNSVVTDDFQHEDISSGFSIAFTTDYREIDPMARIIKPSEDLYFASVAEPKSFALEGAPVLCEINAVPYTNGFFNSLVSSWSVD